MGREGVEPPTDPNLGSALAGHKPATLPIKLSALTFIGRQGGIRTHSVSNVRDFHTTIVFTTLSVCGLDFVFILYGCIV